MKVLLNLFFFVLALGVMRLLLGYLSAIFDFNLSDYKTVSWGLVILLSFVLSQLMGKELR